MTGTTSGKPFFRIASGCPERFGGRQGLTTRPALGYLIPMNINLTPQDRIALVKGIFTRVAPKYDLLNHLLSLNRDAFWRQAAARRTKLFRTGRILDIASGTGDLALTLAEVRPEAKVLAADFTYAMLDLARSKVDQRGLAGRILVAQADAMRLPFASESFDSVTIAFGIRNIPDREAALREMLRVLAPGGRAVILELTFPRWSFIRRVYHSYLNRLIPKLGGAVSGHALAYQYLADSIMEFPDPEDFRRLMVRAGFENTRILKMTFGVAVIHWGERPAVSASEWRTGPAS